MRVAALWFPDWPIQALQETAVGACAIVSQHRVEACGDLRKHHAIAIRVSLLHP